MNDNEEEIIDAAHEIIERELHGGSVQKPTELNQNDEVRPIPSLVSQSAEPIKEQKRRIVVVGGGVSGLSTAALLARRGHSVSLFEKNATFGGSAEVVTENGYVFDKNISLCTMPDVLQHFMDLVGGEGSDKKVPMEPFVPALRFLLPDQNKTYDIVGDIDTNADLFESIESGAGKKLATYLAECKALYMDARDGFLFENRDSLFDSAFRLSRFKFLTTIGATIDKIFSNQILQAILKSQILFFGASPYEAPAFYGVAHYAFMGQGIFEPQGGMQAFVEFLKNAGQEAGVSFSANAAVKKIVIEKGIVKAVELSSGRTIEADSVVSAIDLHQSETELLAKEWQSYPESYWSKKTVAPSSYVLHLGLSEACKNLASHNVVLPKVFYKSMNDIFGTAQFPENPWMYIHYRSADTNAAEKVTGPSLSVFVPISASLSYNDADLELYTEKILHVLESVLNITELKTKATYLQAYGPKDFAKNYGSYKGTIFGISPTRTQLINRPKNKSNKAEELYYAGPDTWPGPGLPLSLISAELVYKRIEKDESSTPLESIKEGVN